MKNKRRVPESREDFREEMTLVLTPLERFELYNAVCMTHRSSEKQKDDILHGDWDADLKFDSWQEETGVAYLAARMEVLSRLRERLEAGE
jgi:hypothetical protein